jgi:NADH-quinone oxidoreductase subunit J
MELVLFGILSLVAVVSAVGVITLRQPVHCALSFLLTLASLAGLYLLLSAPFVAVIQIIIYAGAIMVLFVFVMMLLHAQRGEGPTQYLPLQGLIGVILAGLFLGLIGFVSIVSTSAEPSESPLATGAKICSGTNLTDISQMAHCLFNQFVFPFELASVLLLAAMIGAVVLSKKGD